MPKRVTFGDVFEVKVGTKLAYIQYIQAERHLGDIVRVFSKLYDDRPSDFEQVTSGHSFRLFYPVKSALTSPALVEHVAHNPLDGEDAQPVRLRNGDEDLHENGRWTLYADGKMEAVTTLTEEQRMWPTVYWMVSHQGLVSCILKANGVAPAAAGHTTGTGKAYFYLYFARKQDANVASSAPILATFSREVSKDDRKWLLTFCGQLDEPLNPILGKMEALALKHNGKFDGFEVPT